MVVKSINDSVGKDGLVPTLLAYSCLLRLGIPHDTRHPDIMQQRLAVHEAVDFKTKVFADSQVREDFSHRNGPNICDVGNAPLGSPLLCFRDRTDKQFSGWNGPFCLLEIDESSDTSLKRYGPSLFWLKHLKLFHPPLAPATPFKSPLR